MEKDRIQMSQRERDVLKVMSAVLSGDRSQVEAARLMGRSVRQVGRLAARLRELGDCGVVHRLRGRPSNHRTDRSLREKALKLCRERYAEFGPTLASEKLKEDDGIAVCPETLRGWMLAEGLWERKRHRDCHRARRVRRSCFGEMVQADASVHDWLEGRGGGNVSRGVGNASRGGGEAWRGPMLTLVGMIDDATDRLLCRFYESETTAAYMDVLDRWVRKFGRPASWYSDRHSIFRAEASVAGYDEPVSVPTQFSRASGELGIELILANSPQAKGRVERVWGTAQDRLVKELRLAQARSIEQANAVLEQKFLPWFNRRCTHAPASGNDAHRPIGKLNLDAILCIQEQRVVANDYTIRFDNHFYQLLPPVWPGQRGGKVIVEQRLDGTMKVRFKNRYLEYNAIPSPSTIDAATTDTATTDTATPSDAAKLGAPPPNPGVYRMGRSP